MNEIIIFTDGSSRGNPGVGGWGAVIVQSGSSEHASPVVTELGGKEDMTTNNRMEITAVLSALLFVEKNTSSPDSLVKIHTDSSYVINGATKWVYGWKKNGWITSQKEDVVNRDLWQDLDRVISALKNDLKIEWKYVGGHIGIKGNERCDEIATGFALGKISQSDLHNGSLDSYEIKDILNISYDTQLKEKKGDSRKRSNAKAFSYVSFLNGKIEIHQTWADCEARVKGKSGAKFKKALSKAEEGDIIKEFTK